MKTIGLFFVYLNSLKPSSRNKKNTMIKIKEAFDNLTPEEFKQLLDAPVWMALLAAYTTDGRITQTEREGAIRLARVRTYTAPKSIREIYLKINENFAKRFKQLDERLPSGTENKLTYIRAQVKAAHKVLHKLDTDIAETLEENFASFYTHVFNSDKGFFHYFALPIISSHVEKKYGGKYSPANA